MADIVNLNRFRKSRARDERAATAAANRAKHGRSKAEKARDKSESAQTAQHLDNHRLDDDTPKD